MIHMLLLVDLHDFLWPFPFQFVCSAQDLHVFSVRILQIDFFFPALDTKRRIDQPIGVAGDHMHAAYMQETLRPGMKVSIRTLIYDSYLSQQFILGSTHSSIMNYFHCYASSYASV